jgi:hypothetical protein
MTAIDLYTDQDLVLEMTKAFAAERS